MSCCVIALAVFSSDILTWSADILYKIRGVRAEEYAYCVNKLFGNMIMTSNCDVTNSAHKVQMTTICH